MTYTRIPSGCDLRPPDERRAAERDHEWHLRTEVPAPNTHARSHREALELGPLERLLTRHSLIAFAAQTAVGVAGVSLARLLPLEWLPLTGYFYFVLGAYYWTAHSQFGR